MKFLLNFTNSYLYLIFNLKNYYKMSHPIKQLWLYNDWANKSIINAIKPQIEKIPSSAIKLLSHIVNAQMIWLSRLNGEKSNLGVWDEHTIMECEKYHNLSSDGLEKKNREYDASEMLNISYLTTKNDQFENLFGDIILHIFNHGTYHRAQIAAAMRKNGFDPINTDYISFVRK